MHYTDVIQRAFRITWTYRPLATIFLLGALAMLSGSGVGIFFSTGVDNAGRNAIDTLHNAVGQAGSYHVSYGLDSQLASLLLSDDVEKFLSLTAIENAVYGLNCLTALGLLIALPLGEIGHAALITGFATFERGDALTFADGWRSGAAHVRKFVGMSLLLAIPILVILAIAAVIAAVLINDTGDYVINEPFWWTGVPLLIALGIAFVISASAANVLQAFARRAIVLEQRSVVDGLKRSWEIFRPRIRLCIGLSIRMLLIADVIGAIAAIPIILFGAVLLISFPSLREVPWPLAMIGAAGAALSSLIVGSAVTVAGSAAFTLAWREFTRATMDAPSSPPV